MASRPRRTPNQHIPPSRTPTRSRARTEPNVFDYLDGDYEVHYAEPDRPAPAATAAATTGGYLSALTGLLPRLWVGGGGDDEQENKAKDKDTYSSGDSDSERQRRRRRRQVHSYTGASPSRSSDNRALVPISQVPPAKPEGGEGGGGWFLSHLPSLPALSLPAILKPTPEPPPQLSPEALDVVVRYLALYTQHTVALNMGQNSTQQIQRQARRLMRGMNREAVSSLHEYLVVLKRLPETPVVFEAGVLERYTGGNKEAAGVLSEGLADVLRDLAEVLEGGYTAPGGWVDGEE
ncbi:hypothetical protein FN846DRAFT_903615 [Sphaerosporella brunnea]|uniref:Uncharacterized protein n=1 Tax=Sphaerosporella brunnea TaxID=1250544 RepID=A0A5J5F739_9PEZI|nr:hypothetical protein FN846DRAFT_903615 [Sphaerosporella brunnea]